METIKKLLEMLDPVSRDTHPNLACVIGFLFGGLGLAIYFRTAVDFLIPVAITVAGLVAYSALGAFGILAGALVAALYGYLRASTSNAMRAALQARMPEVLAG